MAMVEHIFKVILIGDAGVGKSSFVKTLLNIPFNERYNPTLGFECHQITINNYNFNIYDTAGQERYGGLREGYFINSDFAIIMLSDSKRNLKSYEDEIKKYCGNIPTIILFNKCELNNTINNYNKLLETKENVLYCSSKNNINIKEPFYYFINQL